jgi:ferredoxin--NADP+ reductase
MPFTIVETERLSPTLTRLVVEAPLVARKRQAGHFVIVRVVDTGERIPLTIVDGSPEAGTITLIVQAVGRTTRLLCGLAPGQALSDVVGPLGNPTPIRAWGRVACVGGGVGTAVVYPIARALRAAGNTVLSVVGARSRDLIVLEREMAECSDSLVVTTDDGSHGRKGLVTLALKEMLDGDGLDAVFAVGPLPMMKAVSELTRPYGVPTLVSLNPIMVDGTGMCGGCRVTVGGQTRFACVDGPEFDGHQVDFDEVMRRNRSYVDLERVADAAAAEAPAAGPSCRSAVAEVSEMAR